ncbi:MAG: MarR family transcriptional regulator [Pseudomonadota bacterium]
MTDTKTKAAVFMLNASPSHLLHRAQQFAANQSADALKAAGVTLRQFAVLAAVAEAEGTSQSQLVDATGIDRSTLADMVARMEKGGLLLRKESTSDLRAKSVWLTSEGRAALKTAAPAVSDADDQLLSALPKNRRASFLSILAVLADASDREILQLEADDETGEKKKVKAKDKERPKAKAKTQKTTKAKAEKSKKKDAKKGKKKKKT